MSGFSCIVQFSRVALPATFDYSWVFGVWDMKGYSALDITEANCFRDTVACSQ